MFVYFEYKQELSIEESRLIEPISHRSLLTEIEGDITEESKEQARTESSISGRISEAKTMLDALGKPYYVRLHYHNHPSQPCETENL